MILPIVFLTGCTFAMGIFGENLCNLCLEAAEQVLSPEIYINAVMGVQK